MLNYVEYVEDLIGDNLTADNAQTVQSMSLRDLRNVREKNLAAGHDCFQAYWESIKPGPTLRNLDPDARVSLLDGWRSAPTPYQRVSGKKGEFRPILHGRIHQSADIFGGDAGYIFESGDPEDRFRALKRYLLYAHRLVLPDPLFYINQYFASESDMFEKSRLSLTGFLDFLYLIRTLVEDGTVSFYPQYEHSEVLSQGLFSDQEFERRVRRDDFDADQKLRLIAWQPRVSELLFFCTRFDARCSFDDPRYEPILGKMAEFGLDLQAEAQDKVRAHDRAALERLGSVQLPNIERLSIKEIVATRSQAEGFNRWRDALGEGLLRIEGAANPEVVHDAIRESLARGRQQLDEEVASSKFLSQLDGPATGFMIGGIAGLAWGGPFGALLTSGTSAILTSIVDYAKKSGKRKAGRALQVHYSVWD